MFFYFLQIHASDTDNYTLAQGLINHEFDAQAAQEGDNAELIVYNLSQFSKEEMPSVFKLAKGLSQEGKLTIKDISNILGDLHDAPEETRKAMIRNSESIGSLALKLTPNSGSKRGLDVISLFKELEKIPHEKIGNVVYIINNSGFNQKFTRDWVNSLITIFASEDYQEANKIKSFMFQLSEKSGVVQYPYLLIQITKLVSDDTRVFDLVKKLVDYSIFHTGDDYLNNFHSLCSSLYCIDQTRREAVANKVIEEMKNREEKISAEDLNNLIFGTDIKLREQ